MDSRRPSASNGPLLISLQRRWQHTGAEIPRNECLWHHRPEESGSDAVNELPRSVGPLSTVKVLELILALEFGFGLRRHIFFPLLGDGIFTQDGAAWEHSRKLLRPQFARQQYRDLNAFREHVDNLIACIPRNGEPIDLQSLFFRLTLDTTTDFLFGESVHSLKADDSGYGARFADDFDVAQNIVVQRFRLLDLYWFIGGRKFRNACRSVQSFVDEIIQRRLDSPDTNSDSKREERYVFFDAVAQETKNKKELRDQLINILLAGRDTTACLLSWTFFLLVRHSNVLDKLRKEVESVVGNNINLQREDLKRMPYLANVLKETLRLFPSVPVNTRTAHQTTILPTGGGPDRSSPVLVRRGDNVAYCVYVMHRRKDLYGEDAEDFRPERWDENLPLYCDKITAAWGYLPFNGGPRVCLGRRYIPTVHVNILMQILMSEDFGLTEASYTVVRILQAFSTIQAAPFERQQSQSWIGYSSHQVQGIKRVSRERQKMTLVISAGDGCPVQLA